MTHYPTEREQLIARGVIRPASAVPAVVEPSTLRLLPAERAQFEAEALRGVLS